MYESAHMSCGTDIYHFQLNFFTLSTCSSKTSASLVLVQWQQEDDELMAIQAQKIVVTVTHT